MATIPIGNFGNAMPDVQQTQIVPSNLGQIGQALGNIGQIAQSRRQQKDQEQRQQEVTAKVIELDQFKQDQNKAQLEVDNVLTSEFSDFVSTLKNDVGNGTYNAAQANESLTAWAEERFMSLQETMPHGIREDIKNYWAESVNRQRGSFVPLQLKASEQQGYAMADQYMQIYTRPSINRTDGEGKLKQGLQSLNLPGAYITEQVHKYNIARDINELDGLIASSFENGDLVGLQATRSKLNDYKYLNGDQIQNFDKTIASRIGALQDRQQTLENKRVTEAGKVLNDYISNVMTGLPMDAVYNADVSQAVQGTEHQQEYDFYQKHSTNFQNFSRLSTSEQLDQINRTRSGMKNTPNTDAKITQDVLGVYERIYNDKVEVSKKNPTQIIKDQGIEMPELTPQSIKSNPKQFANDIGSIGSTLLALQKRDPNVVIKPISPEQLPQIKQAFDGMGVTQKLTFIGDLIQQTKHLDGGDKVWGATLGQLGSGDSTYVMAGIAKFYGYQSNYGVDLATALISGNQLLKNDQLKLPEDEMRSVFNETVGNSLTGDSANKAYQAYKSTYAYLLNQRGMVIADPKNPTKAERDLMKNAMSVGVGDFYVQPNNFKNYVGDSIEEWKVSKPYDMTIERFEASLERGYTRLATQHNISVDDLKDFRLRASPYRTKDGGQVYTLHYANGTSLSQNKDGQTIPVFLAVPRN